VIEKWLKEEEERQKRLERECSRQLILLKNTQKDRTLINPVLQGLQILAKYTEDLGITLEENYIEAVYVEYIREMSDEDIIMLAKLGWSHNDHRFCYVD
jgi:hypothetical protein